MKKLKILIKFSFYVSFSINIVYYSLSSFTFSVTEGKSNLFVPVYNSLLQQYKIKPIIDLMKMNSAFAFFGKGLHVSTYIEFVDYTEENRELRNRSYSDNFYAINSRVRAVSLATHLSFNYVTPINTLKTKLKEEQVQSGDKKSMVNIRSEVQRKERILKKILYQAGVFNLSESASGCCFDVNFYYIFPNLIDQSVSGRSLYKAISYRFSKVPFEN